MGRKRLELSEEEIRERKRLQKINSAHKLREQIKAKERLKVLAATQFTEEEFKEGERLKRSLLRRDEKNFKRRIANLPPEKVEEVRKKKSEYYKRRRAEKQNQESLDDYSTQQSVGYSDADDITIIEADDNNFTGTRVYFEEAESNEELPRQVCSYADALKLLKPVEEFVMLEENYRAISLLTQLEEIFKNPPSKDD